MSFASYYESERYLREHRSYFSPARTRRETDLLQRALSLRKHDRILDVACGHGRHAIELARRGFDVVGVDRSHRLLQQAQRDAARRGIDVPFKQQNVEALRLTERFNKAYMLFADVGILDLHRTLQSLHRVLRPGGTLLIDADSLFRLVAYLRAHPRAPFSFDPSSLQLRERRQAGAVQYYTPADFSAALDAHGFHVDRTLGGYRSEPFTVRSDRMILVARRTRA